MSTLHQPIRNLRNHKRLAEQQLENDNRPNKQPKNLKSTHVQENNAKSGITKSNRQALTNISNTHGQKSSTVINIKKEVKIIKEATKSVQIVETTHTEEQVLYHHGQIACQHRNSDANMNN